MSAANQAQAQALSTLDQVLQEVEAHQAAQVLPQVLAQTDPALQQPISAGAFTKEGVAASSFEVGAAQAVAEYEKSPEIPVEVASYMEKVVADENQVPQEIAIAGSDMTMMPVRVATTPVIVLPISPEEEALGSKKNPHASIRWLVEWSKKIMLVFSGKVIYRPDQTE